MLVRQMVQVYRNELTVRLDPTHKVSMTRLNSRLARLPNSHKRVVYFGDSRIEMWRPLPSTSGIQALNRGAGGDTTAQLELRFARDVLGLEPDAVVIEAGINDLKAIGVMPYRSSALIENTTKRLKFFVDELQRKHIPVVLITIIPPGPIELSRRLLWSDQILPAVETVNRAIRSWDGPELFVVDADLALVEKGQVRKAYSNDALHLNERGYQALAPMVEDAVRRAVSSVAKGND